MSAIKKRDNKYIFIPSLFFISKNKVQLLMYNYDPNRIDLICHRLYTRSTEIRWRTKKILAILAIEKTFENDK